MDDGGKPEGLGDYLRGTGGVLDSSHSSREGGDNTHKATSTTDKAGSRTGRAVNTLTSVNPCVSRVGWLSVANLTEDNDPRRGDALSLAVPTAALFG